MKKEKLLEFNMDLHTIDKTLERMINTMKRGSKGRFYLETIKLFVVSLIAKYHIQYITKNNFKEVGK